MKSVISYKGSMRAKRLKCSYDIFCAFLDVGVMPISQAIALIV